MSMRIILKALNLAWEKIKMSSGRAPSKRGRGKGSISQVNNSGASSATCNVRCDTTACSEKDPTKWNNMFGSLFGVASVPEEKLIQLTENWHQIICRWYPDFHEKVYCVPPVHFRKVSYTSRPKKQAQPSEPYERFGMQMYKPPQDSAVKDDEAQQRVIFTFSAFCRQKGGTAFILSNMEFQNYLSKDYGVSSSPVCFPKADKSNKDEEGDFDVLLIDKQHGIVSLEVKSIKENQAFGGKDPLKAILEKIQDAEKQVRKAVQILRKLMSDLNTDDRITIKGGFAFPNISREVFKKALAYDNNPAEISNIKLVMSQDEILASTFCAEEFPEPNITGESLVDSKILERLDEIWTRLGTVHGPFRPLENDLYEKIVARFCGPLTTVKIYTERNYPRVRLLLNVQKAGCKEKVIPEEAVLQAGAARIVARKFSELVLLQDQIAVLQNKVDFDFVHLEGPPGTGKTLILLLRILMWLDEGHMVWLMSLSPPSRSVTHVLMEQVKKMIEQYHSEERAKEMKSRIHLFMLIRHESTLDEEYYRRQLLKFRERAKCTTTRPYVGYPRPPTLPPVTAPHDRKVCLVLDECGMAGTGLHAFFNQVSELHRAGEFNNKTFDKGLSVWSASLEVVGRPCYVTDPDSTKKFGVLWTLKLPIRCPPSVQRALLLVQPYLNQENVCCFQKENILPNPTTTHAYPADGLPVFLIAHGSHGQSGTDIWHCADCGEELGRYLQDTLHIGKEQCTCEDKDINFDREGVEAKFAKCPDCGKLEKGSLPACDRPLKHNDVMVVATQRAFQMSVPISGFVNALAKRNLKVSINTAREEGDAPIPPDDVILIADLTSIHGLERAIIVIIPEINSPAPASDDQEMTSNPDPVRGSEQTPDRSGTPDAARVQDADADSGSDSKKPHLFIDPVIVNNDPIIKSAMEKGEENVHVAGDGTGCSPRERSDQVTNTEASGTNSADPPPPRKASKRKQQTEPEEGAEGADFVRRGTAEQPPKDSFTYADCHSELQVKAALESLSPQSKRDVFYIGSRAVCQLILIHLGGENHLQEVQTTEPMQTD